MTIVSVAEVVNGPCCSAMTSPVPDKTAEVAHCVTSLEALRSRLLGKDLIDNEWKQGWMANLQERNEDAIED